jgi:hypothetical protein
MDRLQAGIVWALAALVLAGCIPITLHESKLEETVPQSIATVVVGETTRAQVREALGVPVVASEFWRFDAFRMKDANVGVVVFPPYVPIPAWTTEEAYSVVSYADDGRVADAAWISRQSGIWSIGNGENLAAGSGSVRVHSYYGTLLLTATPERRDAYWHDHPARDRCRVVIGMAPYTYDAKIRIDGKSKVAFPRLATPLSQGLVSVELAPGRHPIDATGTDARFSAATEVECGAGDRRYVGVGLEHDEAATGYGSLKKLDARLEVSSELPEALREQRLLIWADGQWLVPQEPAP